mmetsp:Transcript_38911/g.63047  ORF Transcript_38911/g.63047 Transcript_38911/m.63047 type:complete len:293 (+) Transcript_38911:232-1110(+)
MCCVFDADGFVCQYSFNCNASSHYSSCVPLFDDQRCGGQPLGYRTQACWHGVLYRERNWADGGDCWRAYHRLDPGDVQRVGRQRRVARSVCYGGIPFGHWRGGVAHVCCRCSSYTLNTHTHTKHFPRVIEGSVLSTVTQSCGSCLLLLLQLYIKQTDRLETLPQSHRRRCSHQHCDAVVWLMFAAAEYYPFRQSHEKKFHPHCGGVRASIHTYMHVCRGCPSLIHSSLPYEFQRKSLIDMVTSPITMTSISAVPLLTHSLTHPLLTYHSPHLTYRRCTHYGVFIKNNYISRG